MTLGHYQYLSSFSKVKEIYENDWQAMGGYRSLALIVPADGAGRRGRYHVYRLDFERADLIMIGNEVTLDIARAVARRSRSRDWEPLSDNDKIVGKWTRKKWEIQGRTKWTRFLGPKAKKWMGA